MITLPFLHILLFLNLKVKLKVHQVLRLKSESPKMTIVAKEPLFLKNGCVIQQTLSVDMTLLLQASRVLWIGAYFM